MKTEAEQQTEARADNLEDEERKPCVCCSKETDTNNKKADVAAAAAKCSCRRESSASSEDSVLSNKVGSLDVTRQNPSVSCWRMCPPPAFPSAPKHRSSPRLRWTRRSCRSCSCGYWPCSRPARSGSRRSSRCSGGAKIASPSQRQRRPWAQELWQPLWLPRVRSRGSPPGLPPTLLQLLRPPPQTGAEPGPRPGRGSGTEPRLQSGLQTGGERRARLM